MDIDVEQLVEIYKEKTKKSCYRIKCLEQVPDILDDKIGGIPYLPLLEEYPKDKNGEDMALLIQVNLANIDLEDYPKSGILEIFIDKELSYPSDYQIRYFKEGLEYQKDLPSIDLSNFITQKPIKISLEKTIDYMPCSDYRYIDILINIINEYFDGDISDYSELAEFIDEDEVREIMYDELEGNRGSIGGYADFTQEDPRSYKKLDKDECLVKIDSELSKEIMIGDSGIIFVLINKNDIKNCNFENALVNWDCM